MRKGLLVVCLSVIQKRSSSTFQVFFIRKNPNALTMKKLIVIVLLSFLGSEIISQDNFQAGYIVKTGNDTVSGLVEYRGRTNNCYVCVFKSGNEEPVQFKSDAILAYGFNKGEVYRSKLIKNGDPEQTTVFLQAIVDGKTNMYIYNDLLHNGRIFVENDSLGVNELRIVKHKKENSNDLITYKEYIGYLKVYLANPKMQSEVNKMDLTISDVKKVIEKSNSHFDIPSKTYPIKMKTDKREKHLVFGIGVGINYSFSSYNFDGDYPVSISDGFTKFNNPGAFLNLSFKFPFFFQGKFSANTGIGYQKLNYQVEYNWPINESQLIDYQQTNIYIPLNFIYELLKTKVTPYLNAGVVVILNQDDANNNVMSTIEDDYAFIISNDKFRDNVSYLLGVGVKYYMGDHFNIDFNLGLSSYFLLTFETREYIRYDNNTATQSASVESIFSNQLSTSFSVHYSF